MTILALIVGVLGGVAIQAYRSTKVRGTKLLDEIKLGTRSD